MTPHRAIANASNRFTFNPMGHVHRAVSANTVLAHRRHCAVNSLAATRNSVDEAVWLAGWTTCYAAHRGITVAAPVIEALDIILGHGTCNAGRDVATNGCVSEAVLPTLVNKLAEGVAVLGAKIGGCFNGPAGAERGVYVGALVGCALAWVVNQGLAFTNFWLKLQVLAMAMLAGAFLTACDGPHDLNMKRLEDAALFAPTLAFDAARRTVQRAWQGLFPTR